MRPGEYTPKEERDESDLVDVCVHGPDESSPKR